MPYDYRHVRDAYDALRDAGVVTDSLPDWSAKMNVQSGTDDYSAGLHDNWLKQASVGVDRLLEMTGLPQLGGAIGSGVGELVGNPEAGERIGRGLPRMAASMIPLAIPGLQPLAPLTMAASAGTEAYTETDSPAAGVISAATAGLMPAAGNIARQAALKGLGAELVGGELAGGGAARAIEGGAGATVDEALAKLGQGAATRAVSEYVPTTFGQAAGAWGAEQLGAAAVGEAGNLGSALYSGQDYHFSPTEQLLNLTLGQAPFAGASVFRHGLAGFGGEAARRHIEETRTNIELTGKALEQRKLLDDVREKTGVEDIPDPLYLAPEEMLANNTKINDLRARQRAATDEGSTFSEEERQKMLAEEEELVKKQGYAPGNILGANIDPTTARRNVVGTEVAFDPELKFRRVQVSDDPANGDLAGKQIGFSTEHEGPQVTSGTFSVPEGYHSEFLPTEGGRFDPEAKLNIAQQKLTAAKSNAELQQAIIDLNHARQGYGMPALDDRVLSAKTIEMKLGGVRDAVQSELERTRQLAKAKDNGQELNALATEHTQKTAELDAASKAAMEGQVVRANTWEELGPGIRFLSNMTRPGHTYRGMTKAEYDNTVGKGLGIKSTQEYSLTGEGTSFADKAETAEDYVNVGRDDPRKTGVPTYLVEVRQGPGMVVDPRDGYIKAQEAIPHGDVTRVLEMTKKGDNVVARDIGPTPASVTAARVRRDEIAARIAEVHPPVANYFDQDRMRKVVNAPLTRENAPLKDRLHENATTLAEAVGMSGDDRAKFLTWVQAGKSGLFAKYGMNAETAGKFLDQEHVKDLYQRVAQSVYDPMSLQEYGERYLKSTGASAEQAKAQTDRAVALAGRGEAFTEDLLKSAPVQPEVTKAQGDMNTALAASPDAQERLKGRLDELGHLDVDALYNAIVGGGKLDHGALNQFDTEVANYLYAKARDHQQTLDVLNAAAHKDVRSDVPAGDIADHTGLPTLAVKEILKNGNERQRAAATLDGLTSVTPATFLSKLYNGWLADPVGAVTDVLKGAKDWFKTPNYYSQTGGPETKEFVAKSQQVEANTRKMERETLKTFWLDNDGNLEPKYVEALKNPAVKGALNQWIDINMKRGQATNAVEMVSPDDPAVVRALKGLNEEQKANVTALMNRVVASNKMNAAQTLEKMENIAVVDGARILNPVMGLKTEQNIALSKAVVGMMSHPEDPALAQQGQMALQRIFALSPEKVGELQDHFKEALEKINEERAHFEANPAQVTQEMYGKFDVTYQKNGREYFTRVDTQAAAQGLGDRIIDIRRNDSDGDTRVDYRAKVAGGAREPTMWFDNHYTSAKKNAAYWSRALFKAQTKLLRDSAEISQRPDLQRFVDMHEANMMTPDPAMGRGMTKAASMWYLGANFASSMVNGTQMFTRGAAELTRLTGKPIESYRKVLDAVREVGEVALGQSKWRSPDHEWVMNRYESDKTGSAYDVVGEKENDITLKMQWALNHGLPRTAAQKTDSLLHRVNDLAMIGYRGVEAVNTKSAMLAAFDFYRSAKGGSLSKEEAYARAEQFNGAVNDVGGKANRPVLMFNTMPRSAAMIMHSMQSFNIGTVGQMVKFIKDGWPGGNLTPAEKWNARKATAQLLTVQAGLAGVLGIPFAGSAAALVNGAFPGLELDKNLRALTQKLFQEDDDHNTPLSDLALNGVPSMFGWDFKSRLSMGNTLPGVSEINGYQYDMVHAPPIQLLTTFLKGGQKVMGGDYLGGAKDMLPPAVKKIVDIARDDHRVVDSQGKPLAGGDRTWGELTGQVLGFQPERLTEHYELNRIKKASEAEHSRQEAKFHEDLANDVLTGNYGDAKEKLRERQAQDPNYDMFAGGRKAVDAALEKTYPRDLRQKLNKADTQLSRLLPVNYGLPKESDRIDYKLKQLQQLGIPTRKQDLQKYAMRDAVAAENPELTRAEIYREADMRLNKVRKVQTLAPDVVDASLPQVALP